MKLILLGSGAVRLDLERWGPAQVVQVNGENLLFDCGRGASILLWRCKTGYGERDLIAPIPTTKPK